MLLLVVPLQMTQTCSHFVNRLSLLQLLRNPLQVIFDNGTHGAMANANLNTNLFLCDWSVCRTRPSIRTITSGVMTRWACPGRYSSCSDVRPSLLTLVHTCEGHKVFAIHSRHAAMNFASSSTLSHEETNHASLLFFICLHFQCRTNTLHTTLTSRTIKKQLL